MKTLKISNLARVARVHTLWMVRWWRDVKSIRECREILWANLDRNRDDSESLKTLTIVATNALYWERECKRAAHDRLNDAYEEILSPNTGARFPSNADGHSYTE